MHGSQTGAEDASATITFERRVGIGVLPCPTVVEIGSTLAVSVLVVETCSVLEGKRTPARRTDTSAAITII